MINYDLFDGMQSSAADLGYGLVFAHILTGGSFERDDTTTKLLDEGKQVAEFSNEL